MLQYILKRLLIMVPTFLFITVVVFVVINAAPGTPGRGGSQSSENADTSANAREGYRLFKEQYNLDKPIVLNLRFTITTERVMRHVQTITRNMAASLPGETEAYAVGITTAGVLEDILNEDYARLQGELSATDLSETERADKQRELQNLGYTSVDPIRPDRPASGDLYDAEETVENWGTDIVPQLLEMATGYLWLTQADAEDPIYDGVGVLASDVTGLGEGPLGGQTVTYDGESWLVHGTFTRKVRFISVQRLSVNARQRVLVQQGERASDEDVARNREIVAENNRISQWTYPLDASDEEISTVLAQWTSWGEENADRWDRSFGDKVSMMFLETRFARYWGNLARLDLGTSIRYRRPVLEIIAEHWRYSIYLSLASLFLAYFISIPIGILGAVRQNQFADRGVAFVLFILYSLPSFFTATMLQTYLTGANVDSPLALFPVSGFNGVDRLEVTTWDYMWDVAWHLVLPVICLTYASLAVLSRYARTGLLDVIRSDYIRTARAKGLSEWVVIIKHAVRNGMIPIITLLGTTLPVLIGGSIIIEYIFNINGMGLLMINAIQYRDYNIIMGILLLSAILTLIGILLSDLAYALVDPRISFD